MPCRRWRIPYGVDVSPNPSILASLRFTAAAGDRLTRQWGAAIIVGSASILCFLTWLLIEIRGESDAYEYRGF